MKAEELRHGNIVEGGHVVTIQYNKGIWGCIITASMFSSGHDWVFVKADDLKPIPLTEEWLVKFGLIRIRDYPVYTLNDLRIELNIIKSEWTADLYINRTVIKHVHQLQNLYFALTGEELTTNAS